jgi:hypothetical protein
MRQCPWTGTDAEYCPIIDMIISEAHIAWHLEYEVEMGRMIKHDNGTYQLVNNPPSSYPGGNNVDG